MSFLKNNRKHQSGYTLVEAVIYLAVLVVVISVVISLLLAMMAGQERVGVIRDINRSGASALEKISREIRAAESISVSDPAVINLSLLNDEGVIENRQFYSSEGNFWFSDGGESQQLLSERVVLSDLNFTEITEAEFSLVLVSLTLSHVRNLDRQEVFQTAVNLR